MKSKEARQFENFADGPSQVGVVQSAFDTIRVGVRFAELGSWHEEDFGKIVYEGKGDPTSAFFGVKAKLDVNAQRRAILEITLPSRNGKDMWVAIYTLDKNEHVDTTAHMHVSGIIDGKLYSGAEAATILSGKMSMLKPKMDEEIKMVYKKQAEALRSEKPF